MGERGEMGFNPEQHPKPADFSQHVEELRRLATKAKELYDLVSEDPDVRTGAEASLRSVLNAALAVADAIPGAGAVGSWGADTAKVWARMKYHRERAEAVARGEDPDKVKLSPIDLTPDVRTEVAVGTEVLELIGADMIPTHAIEGGLQLRKDWPRIKKGFERLRELLAAHAKPTAQTVEAAAAFGVELP